MPYWVYSDRDLYDEEQERIFRGPTWNFLCLEAELPKPEHAIARSSLGAMPVVVTRDEDGKLNAFENRCAHRGSLLCSTSAARRATSSASITTGATTSAGNLTGVAFRKGLGGKGGMPADCRPEEHAPRKLRVETLCGLVFGTLVGRRAAARAISRAGDRRRASAA